MNAPAADRYSHWRRNLAGQKVEIHDGVPHLGYYRRRFKQGGKYGPWLPASIFLNDAGEIVAEVNGDQVDPVEHWTYFVGEPISEEAYLYHQTNGRWPEDPDPTVESENPRARIGGNNPPSELPIEDSATENSSVAESEAASDPELDALMVQVEEAKSQARKAYADLKLDAAESTAHRAQNVRERLQKLSKDIDALRVARKQPYLDACRQIDNYFRDPIQHPVDIADQLAKRIKTWRDAETERRRQAAEEERQRIIEEQRRQAEAEAEARRLAAEQAGEQAPEPEPAPELPPPPPVEAPKVMLGGGVSGRRSGGRKVVTAKIVDQDAVYQHFREHADVKGLLQKLANAAIKKAPVPGCERLTDEAA